MKPIVESFGSEGTYTPFTSTLSISPTDLSWKYFDGEVSLHCNENPNYVFPENWCTYFSAAE
jgi:hypothetical protein